MSFQGFTKTDFEVFTLPDFASRMPTLKATITPKLKLVAEELAPKLSIKFGHELFPHVAQHLRRSVNAPEETWAAFSREKRAYKPVVHTRVAINGASVRITLHLEDYADDKAAFAHGLKQNAEYLGNYLAEHSEILSFDLSDPYGKPMNGRSLNSDAIAAFADRLASVKSQHAGFGIVISKSDPVLKNPSAFLKRAVRESLKLMPLYRLGYDPGVILK